jgi:hypothetical protein
MKERSYGFRNDQRYRQKVLLTCGRRGTGAKFDEALNMYATLGPVGVDVPGGSGVPPGAVGLAVLVVFALTVAFRTLGAISAGRR